MGTTYFQKKHMAYVSYQIYLEKIPEPLVILGLVLSTWRPLIYRRTFSMDFFSKFGYKTYAMCVFENMTYSLVGLGLVDVVDVDEHDLEASLSCFH